MNQFIALILFSLMTLSCTKLHKTSTDPKTKKERVKKSRPISINNGKFFNQNGQQYLYGGKENKQHFNITNYELNNDQFHYGIGREKFPALLEPSFITVQQADTIWDDNERFLIAYSGDDVKAYSIKDLTRHEVVNDELNGQPIMAAYCILADLGAIYERNYGNHILTFALSGYTYYDDEVWNGLDGFVLWDRETESLWWPLIGRAVSGSLQGVKLLEMDKSHWEDSNWAKIKKVFPHAKVLKSGQDFERPKTWQKIDNVHSIRENYILKTN